MAKRKTVDDLRFEILCYLRLAGVEDAVELLEKYEKLLKMSQPIKYKHIGIYRVPLDIYNGCLQVVPKEVMQRFEQRLQHMINTEHDLQKLIKLRNNIPVQYIDLYNEYSNVTTEEAKSKYN